MRLMFMLALRDVLRNGWRTALSLAAVGAAVAVVVWTYGTYSTQGAQTGEFAREMLGGYDLWLSPSTPGRARKGESAPAGPGRPVVPLLTENRIERLRTLPGVAEVCPLRLATVQLKPEGARTVHMPRVTLAACGAAAMPDIAGGLREGRWLHPGGGALEAVFNRSYEAYFRINRVDVGVGSEIVVGTKRGDFRVRVVGVFDARNTIDNYPAFFMTREAAQIVTGEGAPKTSADSIPGTPGTPGGRNGRGARDVAAQGAQGAEYNAAFIRFSSSAGVGKAALAQTVREEFAGEDSGFILHDHAGLSAALAAARQPSAADYSGYYLVAVAFLASAFIIFTALNMGITERMRQLGMLRAVGMSRCQGAWYVFFNSLLLGAAGAGLGLLGGYVALMATTLGRPELFPHGVALDWLCYVLALGCSLGGALAGMVFPLWSVWRLSPLEALAPTSAFNFRAFPRVLCGIGLLLLLPAYIICYLLELPAMTRYIAYAAIGAPAAGIGCILLTPALIFAAERIFTRPLARLLRLAPEFLAGQLTGRLWQSAGVAISLTIGLGLFIAVQTWGYSMYEPFRPERDMPDAIISFLPDGLPPELAGEVAEAPGIMPGRCAPLYLRQLPAAQKTMQHLRGKEQVMINQDNFLVVGIDPLMVFGGDNPIITARFTQGNREEALAKVARGGYCIVPHTFYNFSGLGVGERIAVNSGGGRPGGRDAPGRDGESGREFELEIAGVVDMPWHLMSAWTGMRGLDGASFGTLSIVFVDTQTALNLARTPNVYFFWANLEADFKALPLEERLARLDAQMARIEGLVERAPLLDPTTGEELPAPRQRSTVTLEDNVLNLASWRAFGMINRMSELPAWALGITMLAVINLILSTVWLRRREFGVLRAVGMSGGQLMRLLLAEGVLICLTACLLSLFFGVYFAACVSSLARYTSMFGGLPIVLVVPWLKILGAVLVTLLVGTLVSLIPAALTMRRTPVELMRQGSESALG